MTRKKLAQTGLYNNPCPVRVFCAFTIELLCTDRMHDNQHYLRIFSVGMNGEELQSVKYID